MKRLLLLLVGCFSVFSLFSQEQKNVNNEEIEIINEIVKTKPRKYSQLRKSLKGKISTENIEYLKKKSEDAGYDLGVICALHITGVRLKNNNQYKKAVEKIGQALEIAEKINNPTAKIILFNTIGSIYKSKNNIESALMYHQSALLETKKIKHLSEANIKSVGIAKNNIGNLYMRLKQYNLALDYFEESLKIQEEIASLKGIAINYQNIGFAQEKLGHIEDALENYKKSLSYNIENNSFLGEVICKNSICGALIKKGEFTKALEIAKTNYKKVKNRVKNDYYYSQTISRLGLAYLKTGQLEKAKPLLEKALEIAEKHDFKDYIIENSFYISELYNELDNVKTAFEFYKKAVEMENETTDEQQILYLSEVISQLKAQPKIENLKISQSEKKIKSYENNRNRNVLIITLISLALLSVALYSIYRQRLLNNDRRVLLLEQQALQAQMNPHFIFNALNSIKLYIINKDQRKAVYYLNKFSKLIRNILDVSKVKDVSLKEELDTMDLYMSIENIRFNNEINYVKQINESLNLDTIKIPPLLLQPFLENAIWHGLSSKKGEKEVVLSAFKVSKNLVEINITDNGVGRKTAMEIKKNKSLKRKSIGLDLTKERLKTFSSDFNHDFSLKYYDLQNEDNTPSGTKVAIRIPLQ